MLNRLLFTDDTFTDHTYLGCYTETFAEYEFIPVESFEFSVSVVEDDIFVRDSNTTIDYEEVFFGERTNKKAKWKSWLFYLIPKGSILMITLFLMFFMVPFMAIALQEPFMLFAVIPLFIVLIIELIKMIDF